MNVAALKQNKWWRRAGVLVVVVLVLWALAWLVVPPLAKGQLQKIATQKLGRAVTIGAIDFKPWSLEFAVSDLQVASADGGQPQLAIRRLYADAELQSLLRLAPVIDALSVEGPTVRLTHLADGSYDIDDILAKFASPPDAPKSDPARFAVYNIRLSDGAVDFDDRTVGRKHALRDLLVSIPFLSNLDSKREVTTEPRMAFKLNGSAFDSSALSTPFADSRKTDAQLHFKGLDVAPYLAYLPAGLPIQLKAGLLDADLKIDFERAATAGLKITGTVEAHQTQVADARGRDLLGFDSLKLSLVDVRPLDGVVHLGEVALAAPQLVVARDAGGALNLLATDRATGATQQVAAPRAAASSASSPAAAKNPLRVQVDKLVLNGGRIGWRDETTRPAAAVELTQLAIEVDGLTWPMDKAARFSGSTRVGGAGLKFQGEATDKVASVQAEVDALPLSLAAPYLAQSLEPTLDGKLSGQVEVAWNAPDLRFKARRLSADGLALTRDKTALASVGRFELVDAEADMSRHTLTIASFTAVAPKVRIERDTDKRWMFERWLKAPASATDEPAAKTAAPKPVDAGVAPGANTAPWRLSINKLAVDNGSVSYADKASDTPVAVEITALTLSAQKIAPDTATVSPLQVSGRIAAGRAEPGRFDYQGQIVLKPLSAEGRLDVAAFPAHAFKTYYADALNIDIRRAFASYRGTVRYETLPAGISLKLAGDSALEDFRANSASLTRSQSPGLERGNNQLLSWKALSLRGLQVAMAPRAPMSVDVRETTLTDFFARVIVDPTGRLNLQNLTKKSQAEADVSEAGTKDAETRRKAGGTTTTVAAPPTAEAMVGPAAVAPASRAAANTVAAADASGGPAPIIHFGPMSLVNGKIDFTDLFVKPNYSADLSGLTGKLSAFASDKPEMADLELRGKAQQTAALDISGKINPLAKPLELDITAKMRDLDLAPLTPYAVRYAGHGIERGKLSMDVNYKISAEGRLAATNKLVLNQLQFGEQVQGAPNSLPVKLAVALLADRNGVIDVDLPISGSLNDPQFSIGALIFKAIGNLLVKAVTSPFSLLTGGFGGGGPGEASAIAFEPGSASLSPVAKESLDKVAKALTERPALQLTVVGTASLEQEREAAKRQRLRQLLLVEKRRAAARAGQDPAEVTEVSDAQYPELLAAVYKRADIPKPRNLIGLARDLPQKEMEDLLLATLTVNEESIRQLAVERGAVVRDYLLAKQLPGERLFLGAVRTNPAGNDWKPGAELNLATR